MHDPNCLFFQVSNEETKLTKEGVSQLAIDFDVQMIWHPSTSQCVTHMHATEMAVV